MSAAIDETDREIIMLLQENARRTFGDIGARVSLSPAAVKRRIDRLERSGVIAGYTAVVDDAKLGRPLVAFTELRIAGTSAVEDIVQVAKTLPEVQAVYVTAGDPDFVIDLRVSDTARLMEILNQLRRTRRVASTKTLIVVDAWKRPHAASPHASVSP